MTAEGSNPRVLTVETLRPASAPTLYFIGVTTGKSSIQEVFPKWAAHLGLDGAVLCGIDVPIHADAATYRTIVDFIKNDPLSYGALVTTHKIDLFRACSDQFDVIDAHAEHMGEVSCISKADGMLVCHAKDPISSGLALDAFVPPGYWATVEADVALLGAGGSTIAISWFLSQMNRGSNRPQRIVITNRSVGRLDRIREVHETLETDTRFEYVLAPDPSDNSAVVSGLPSGSLVVNATGLGKDAPGSPLDDTVVFPLDGLVWDLNYRGDLLFLDQANAQAREQNLTVVDGWVYFLHGWTQVIAEVFHIEIPTSGPTFDALSLIAAGTRS